MINPCLKLLISDLGGLEGKVSFGTQGVNRIVDSRWRAVHLHVFAKNYEDVSMRGK